MAIYEIKHPVWGSNLSEQVEALVYKGLGNRGNYNFTTEKYKDFFGKTKIRGREEFVGSGNVVTTDDNEIAKRQYRHRCGLLKITMTQLSKGTVMFTVFLDGHVVSDFPSNEIEFRLAPDDLKENANRPIAEIWFRGEGKRWGPLNLYVASRIICTFADKEQMEQYLDLTNRRVSKPGMHNKSIVYQGKIYNAISNSQYQSNDGSILPHLLMMYLLLSPSEQQTFAAQNPEVQDLLGGVTQDVTRTDDEFENAKDPQFADGAAYDDGNSEPNDSDGDSNDSGGDCSDGGGDDGGGSD